MKDENGKTVYRRGVSINGEDRGINEAVRKNILMTVVNRYILKI